jgi:hypothetical protein
MANFGPKEVLILIYSFLLTKPLYALLRWLFVNKFIYIELSGEPEAKKTARIKTWVAYSIAAVWLVGCLIVVISLSVAIEDKYNAQEMWLASAMVQLILYLILWIPIISACIALYHHSMNKSLD